MVCEGGVVIGQQVVVVYGEGAAGEVTGIVVDSTIGFMVLIFEELGATHIVMKQCVSGLNDAASPVPQGGFVRSSGADGSSGIFDGGVVEDDAALSVRKLADVFMALHDDALPHLAVARAGECAAVYDKLPARTHDDTARITHMDCPTDIKCL